MLLTVESAEETKKKEKELADKQITEDDNKLQAYFAENNLSPKKTESGLYYIIDKEGTGPTVEKGQKVTVDYTGTNLAGKPFDSNVDPQFNHVEPFSFAAGVGQVIPGWDEGLVGKPVGSQVLLVIPADKGYGDAGSPPTIPGGATLVFVVDILAASGGPKEE